MGCHVTIKDIAKESGYAISTVSRALNNHPDVSEETKQRIQKIVEERGFEPNANARQLKRQQAKIIALVVKSTANMFFADMLAELQRLVGEAGYESMVQYLHENDNEVLVAQKICREIKPRGIVFLGGNERNFEQNFQNIKIPSVLCTTVMEDVAFFNLSMVGVDDRAAGRAAMETLLKNGHRDICMIGADPAESTPTKLRLEGAAQMLESWGVQNSPDHFLMSDFTWEGAYAVMQEYLDTHTAPTAVFASSDTQAIGAVRAILDAGLSVPGDISVLGFDGTPITQYYNPTLATMAQPMGRIAKTSIETLIKSIERKKPSITVLLEASYKHGASMRSLD